MNNNYETKYAVFFSQILKHFKNKNILELFLYTLLTLQIATRKFENDRTTPTCLNI